MTWYLVWSFIAMYVMKTEAESCNTNPWFIKTDEILHPKTAGGFLLSTTAVRADCASRCERRPTCSMFYHNPTDDKCFLASSTQAVEPDTSYSDTSENRFEKYRKPGPPASCAEIKLLDDLHVDGEYWLYPSILPERKVKVFCSDMDTLTPKEYITLTKSNFGNFPPECNLNCHGDSTSGCPSGAVGHVDYTKIRVDIHSLVVDRTDKTFTTGTGSFADYGAAGDCYNTIWSMPTDLTLPCGPRGKFRMDAIGTGLRFNNETVWTASGYKAIAITDWSSAWTSVNITCGGWCGGCPPDVIQLQLNPACYPTTCSEVKTLGNIHVDGEYWLYPSGQKVKVFCYGMDTSSPTEYVTLINSNYGNYPPECNLNCHGDSTSGCPSGNVGHVDYTKIRVDISTGIVDRTDKTFTTGTGSFADYGSAADCYNTIWGIPTDPTLPCGPRGKFIIDTTGTGLKFSTETVWTVVGYKAVALVSFSPDGRLVDITCGGWCGECTPDILRLVHNPGEIIPDENAVDIDLLC